MCSARSGMAASCRMEKDLPQPWRQYRAKACQRGRSLHSAAGFDCASCRRDWPALQCSPKSRSCAAFSSESDECRGETFKFPGIEDSCGITSLSAGQADAKVLLEHDRAHWSIEQSIALSTASTHSTKATAASGPASGPRTRPRSDGLRLRRLCALPKRSRRRRRCRTATRGGGSTTFA